MNPEAIRQLQISLGLPPTGVFDNTTINAMTSAVGKAISTNQDIARYAGNNNPEALLNAYMSGDWSGVTDLSGKPFTPKQQQDAAKQAEKALAPAYKAEEAYDRSVTEDALRGDQQSLGDFQKSEAKAFGKDKNTLDDNAVSQGVLFSGSRVQKLNDLRTTYQDREALARRQAADKISSDARSYQYNYGDDAAGKLSQYYQLPGQSNFNPNVAGGKVTGGSLSDVYNPSQFKFQGVKPVAQQTSIQTRAASLLGNRANKLSLSGYGRQY